jgi:hypothetical protein
MGQSEVDRERQVTFRAGLYLPQAGVPSSSAIEDGFGSNPVPGPSIKRARPATKWSKIRTKPPGDTVKSSGAYLFIFDKDA